jgi:hypothetical protein
MSMFPILSAGDDGGYHVTYSQLETHPGFSHPTSCKPSPLITALSKDASWTSPIHNHHLISRLITISMF